MFTLVLFEITNMVALFRSIPESLGLLIFSVGLIALAVSLRRIFNRKETAKENLKQTEMKTN